MKALSGFSRVLALLALTLGLALVANPASRAIASVTNVNASPGAVVFPNTSTVTVTAQETGAGSITVQVASGTLSLVGCSTNSGACTTTTNNGPGSSVQVTNAGDGDGNTSETMTLVFQFSPPNVAFATADPVQACQGGVCDSDSINVFPSGFSTATNISFDVVSTAVCGNSVVVTAFVTSNGVPVPDGTVVVFSANNGLSSVATVTSGGIATANVFVPVGVAGSFVITASSGGATFSTVIAVTCNVAGPPALIRLNITPQSITCGSTASVLAHVFDQFGNPITNVTVSFTSTLGSITPAAPVIGLTADAVLTSFPQQPGVATITARAGNAVATGTVTIVCPAAPQPAAPTSAPPVIQPTPRPATPGVLPPNTGEAGLK